MFKALSFTPYPVNRSPSGTFPPRSLRSLWRRFLRASVDWGRVYYIAFHQVRGLTDVFEWCFAVLSRSAERFVSACARAWVGQTSMGLNPMVLQNTNLS